MFTTLFVLLLVDFSCTLDNILCRNCGSHLLTPDKIISKVSTFAHYTFNDTLFNRNEVLVHVLYKYIIYQFPVITSSQTNCVGRGEWEEDELWFPQYSWKPCICSECGMLIGLMFQHNSTQIVQSHDKFFSLMLPNLISQNFCKLPDSIPRQLFINMDDSGLSAEDKEFLEKCEVELKDRYTEKDEEFMKVFNREPTIPPIIEKWWSPYNSGRRNDRRYNRRYSHHHGNSGYQGRSNSDHRRNRDDNSSYRPYRSRY